MRTHCSLSWWKRTSVVFALGVIAGCGTAPAPAPAADEQAHGHATTADAPDPATDEVAFLTQLLLTKGHLRVGVELYRQGAFEMADRHMKHPHDELYAELEPAFAARGLTGFADELTALADGVEGRQSVDRVDAAYVTVVAAIDRLTGTGAEPSREARDVAQVIANLIRTAADEYAVGVQDNRVVEPQEYQDAWGFTQVAIEQAGGLAKRGGPVGDVAADIETRIESLAPAWPSIVPPDTISSGASRLSDAAAAIEAAVGRL